MARSTHHQNYRALLSILREIRIAAGVSQAVLAARLGNTQTFVSKFERGERRLDVVEFVEICEALGNDATSVFLQYIERKSMAKRKIGKGVRRTRT